MNRLSARRTYTPPFCTVCLTLLTALLAGCAGPQQISEPTPVEPTSDPKPAVVWSILAATDSGVWFSDEPDTLVSINAPAARKWSSSSGRWIATAVAVADSMRLVLTDLNSGRTSTIADGAPIAEYSVAWSQAEDRMAFGYRSGVEKGIVLVDTGTGETHSVGCSASYKVFAIRDDGRLVVGDSGALYLVESEDCATVSRIDLDKRHDVAVSPTGRHVAYVFRKLVFNRRAYSYDPDSTLFIRSFESPDETRVTSDRYRARNLAWSPSGTRLAFDARSVDGAQERQLAYFDLEDGTAGYVLNPGDMNVPVDRGAVWSSSGEAILFERFDPETSVSQLAVRHFVDRRLHVVTSSDAANPIVSYGFAGEQGVLVHYADGTSVLFGVDGKKVRAFPPDFAVLSAIRS